AGVSLGADKSPVVALYAKVVIVPAPWWLAYAHLPFGLKAMWRGLPAFAMVAGLLGVALPVATSNLNIAMCPDPAHATNTKFPVTPSSSAACAVSPAGTDEDAVNVPSW